MANKNVATVVDIRDGAWQFAYSGSAVKKSLYEKAAKLELEYTEVMENIQSTFNEAPVEVVVAAFVQTFSEDRNWRGEVLASLCRKAVKLQSEILNARRAANGFSDTIVYKMSLEDLKRLGLGLIGEEHG